MGWIHSEVIVTNLLHTQCELPLFGHEPMACLQCLDSIGFPLLLKPHLVGGSYATLAAVAAQMNRCCELCPAELTMFCVSDLVHTFYA